MSKARIYGTKTACIPNREADRRRGSRVYQKNLEFAANDIARYEAKWERKLSKMKEKANR